MEETTVKTSKSQKNLKALFEPKSIAVIGASRREDSVGYAILDNLVTEPFQGKIYPVNPKADTLKDIKCYPSISDISGPVDLAVLVVPSKVVPATLKQCGEKGVKAAIIITAGFKEIGLEGKQLEKEAVAIAEEYNMPLLGPNCLGLINCDSNLRMNASFSRFMPKPGNIAFISQSGALGTAVLDYAKGKDIGFSKFISLGNKANLSELDILMYLKDDPQTDVILMYVEDLACGREFIKAAREITGDLEKTKPILAIKSGRTAEGAKAASSHTGSLMGSDKVYDAIFAQSGVMRVDSVGEIFDYALAFANQPLPESNRVAIVTNAGGPGIMATDSCVRYKLKMAELQPETIAELRKHLPPTANFSNPIDVIGDAHADRYENALKSIVADPNVDGVIVILTPQAMTDIKDTAKIIVKISKETNKPILTCFMGLADVYSGVEILEKNLIPHYPFPGEAAHTMSVMAKYKQWIGRPRMKFTQNEVDRDKAAAILEEAKESGKNYLTIDQSMDVFKAYGFPLLPYAFAVSAEEAAKKAERVGFPVVMKVVSQDVVHKFDVGGVQLDLRNKEDVTKAYDQMMESIITKLPKAKIDGVFIQAMGKKGKEVILGMNRDPHFGPTLMFGLGGIYVEVLKDVTFRLAPIRKSGARHMVEEIRTYALLKGVRGEAPSDTETIVDCLTRLSQLSMEQDLIDEIDINPLLVYSEGEGARVVDARIIIK